MPINKLVIYGQQTPTTEVDVEIYELSSSNRDVNNKISIDNIGDKQVEFTFQDGTVWRADAATMHELFPEMDEATKPAGQRSFGEDGSFELPGSISSTGEDRGLFGKIVLKVLKVFGKKAVSAGIGEIAERLENNHLKNGIPADSPIWANGFEKQFLEAGAGIFNIDKDFNFSTFTGGQPSKPFFLFIHGTNSDTLGAFKELQAADAWNSLHTLYGGNVIAFQHRTLTESPLQNVVKLAKMLPNAATLHVISHSRGGIVGDILNLYSGDVPVGFSNQNIELLKKEGNRQNDIDNIKELNKIFSKKKLTVAKFIRVACPAAGTKLASKRLDHILNAFFNIFGGNLNPYADVFKELLSAAISTKDNVDVLPGIEAQSPSSPFIKVLNDQSEKSAIDGGPLAVISGNGTLSFSLSGLLVILGKLFYWQRNDLVVNTDSMYLGAKRKNNIQYFFDQSEDVNHIKYFANPSTRQAINLVLQTDAGNAIPGFTSILQNEIPASDRDERGLEYGELPPFEGLPSGNRPIVVLLPGIMGSNLERNGSKLWLNYIGSIFGGLTKLEYSSDGKIKATSVIKTSYGRLANRLLNNYDVVVYPFDWRKQLNECASEFNEKMKSLLQFGQPIKIIGHSMGGVLVRDFIINHDETWQQLNSSSGFRLLFLGSPLGGSFRIPTVLFGQDSIIDSLNMLDRFNTKKELLEMFCKFQGILSLLPLTTDKENDFADISVWEAMRKALGDNQWPLPSKDDLADFKKYRDAINAKKDLIDYSKMTYIAGKDKQTPCGYFNDNIPPRTELVFLYTAEGDQSVTWELGIPKKMKEKAPGEKDRVYYVDVSHGALANEPDIFDGIEEILENGFTNLLPNQPETTREQEKLFRGQSSYNFDLSERGLEKSLLAIGDKGNKKPLGSQVPIAVSISNGDLKYASYPVLAGHFLNDGVLYAEKVIDINLENRLSDKHRLGIYPGEIGTNDFFESNTKTDFHGAIIVGLGEQGNLTSFQLSRSVEQGVANYLLSIQKLDSKKVVGISALIIGSGYGGLSLDSSLKAIIEGVNNANQKSIEYFKDRCKTVQHIEFIEVYSDRALSCMYTLYNIVENENDTYKVFIDNKKIKELLGIRRRIPLDISEDWWNRLTVKYKPAKEGSEEPDSMVFGSATGDAREEQNELFSSTPLIDLFIKEVSTKNQWSPCSAKTLFELMVPNEMKEKLKKKGNITWVLDTHTAAYPWELLQDSAVNAKPLCINAGMVRQLSTSDYRIQVKRVADLKALVIADPILNGFVNQLPGAKKEGEEVEKILKNSIYPVTSVIGKDAVSVVRSLFCEDFSIIHLAGHGSFNAKNPKRSGMVIGKDIFLTVFDIQQMPVVPELVFVNCCHLGKVTAADERFYQDRYKLAANIGTELIRIGVKAVVAAGWAVNDAAALDFARTFYYEMFKGETFGKAIKCAREDVYNKHPDNNTWGAYQCYGDPYFKLKKTINTKVKKPFKYIVPEQAEIDLENLFNTLQMGAKKEESLANLDSILEAMKDAEINNAVVIEKQALIYQELGMYKKAVEKFAELLSFEKAAFTFSSMEKYCNARAKLHVQEYLEITKDNINEKIRLVTIRKIDGVIKNLIELLDSGETAERLNLLGSTYKRKAMMLTDKEKRQEVYKLSLACYEAAARIAGNNNNAYSITNALEIGNILLLSGLIPGEISIKVSKNTYKFTLRSQSEALKEIEAQKKIINERDGTGNLNYWDMVASTNFDICTLLVEGEKEDAINVNKKGKQQKFEEKNSAIKGWEEIKQDFKKLWQKAGSVGKKTAEIEHLQFLTYALSTIKDTPKKQSAHKSDGANSKTDNDVEFMIDQLKEVHEKATGKKSTAITLKEKKPVKKVAIKKATVQKKRLSKPAIVAKKKRK